MRIHDWYRARSDESGSTSPLTDGQTTAVPPGHRPGVLLGWIAICLAAVRAENALSARRSPAQTREFPGARGRRLARSRRLAGGVGHEPAI
jgi:hypothetical protein